MLLTTRRSYLQFEVTYDFIEQTEKKNVMRHRLMPFEYVRHAHICAAFVDVPMIIWHIAVVLLDFNSTGSRNFTAHGNCSTRTNDQPFLFHEL